jgi:hypothetical protein
LGFGLLEGTKTVAASDDEGWMYHYGLIVERHNFVIQRHKFYQYYTTHSKYIRFTERAPKIQTQHQSNNASLNHV